MIKFQINHHYIWDLYTSVHGTINDMHGYSNAIRTFAEKYNCTLMPGSFGASCKEEDFVILKLSHPDAVIDAKKIKFKINWRFRARP